MIVEPRPTKLETEVIIVHELVHALHRQHLATGSDLGEGGGFELPSPFIAAVESIPQLVAFRYLETFPQEERDLVEPELPIVTPAMVDLVGEVPAAMLNFAYFTAVPLAEAVFAERGAAGLLELLRAPPTTTEQVLYPDRWLSGENRVSQAAPILPSDATYVDEGRLGVAMLGLLLDEVSTAGARRALLSEWTGDRWAMYRTPETGDADCLSVVVEMDSVEAAAKLAELLGQAVTPSVVLDGQPRLRFDTCAPAPS